MAGICFLTSTCIAQEFRWELVFDEMPEISFRGIDAVDDSVCWVSGSMGTILKTTNGGKSWEQLEIPETDSLDFRDIEAFGPDTAVAMSIGSGEQSRLYRTVNGGSSWNLVHQNSYEQGFYDAIAFWKNGRGVLQGDPVEGRLFIMVTNDGGKTWQEIPREQMPAVGDGEYAFAASGSQLVTLDGGLAWIGTGGAAARVLHSKNYGMTWTAEGTPIIQGAPSTGIFSLAFKNEQFGMAVGGDYTKEQEGTDNVIYCENGGRDWSLLKEANLDYRSSIQVVDGFFIVTGPSGTDHSNDNGKNWRPIEGPGFHALSVGEGGVEAVWAAGAEGRIGKLVRN